VLRGHPQSLKAAGQRDGAGRLKVYIAYSPMLYIGHPITNQKRKPYGEIVKYAKVTSGVEGGTSCLLAALMGKPHYKPNYIQEF